MVNYIPSKGDIVTLDFDPQKGHEQKGRRPALILSNKTFNKALGLASPYLLFQQILYFLSYNQ